MITFVAVSVYIMVVTSANLFGMNCSMLLIMIGVMVLNMLSSALYIEEMCFSWFILHMLVCG